MIPPCVTLGWVPTRYPVRHVPPRIRRASRHVRHRTSTSSSRSTAWVGSLPTAIAPWRSRRTAVGKGSGGSAKAAATRAARSALPGTPRATNGSRGRSSPVSGSAAGSGNSPASVSAIEAGRCACAMASTSGRAAYTARWIARSDEGCRPLADTATPLGWFEPDDHEVLRHEFILAPPGRREQEPVTVKARGQVAFPGRDESASAQPSPGFDQSARGSCVATLTHLPILRPRPRSAPRCDLALCHLGRHGQPFGAVLQAARSIRAGCPSGAIWTMIPQVSQEISRWLIGSTFAGSVHHGHSIVII